MTDTCGYLKDNNEPCELPACRPDGRCWHHTEAEPRANGGRDSKLTKERQEGIAHLIEQGASIGEAAQRNGIHRETFYRWINRGEEQDEGIYADFHDRLVRARGEGQGTYRSAIMQIAIETNDVAALMSMLKQRYPDDWGDVDRGQQSDGVIINMKEVEEYDVDPDTLEVTQRE